MSIYFAFYLFLCIFADEDNNYLYYDRRKTNISSS